MSYSSKTSSDVELRKKVAADHSNQNSSKSKSKGLLKPPTKIKVIDSYYALLEQMKAEFFDKYGKVEFESTNIHDFTFMDLVGSGSFGQVALAKHKEKDKYYAVKIMSKAQIMRHKQVDHMRNEKEIGKAILHPFVVHLELTFKDPCNIYFVLPFSTGGDLFSRMRRVTLFKEAEAQFYSAQILLALEYLHYLNILHRDLKPENIVIESDGYLKLADFGFAKLINYRTYTLCGTPEYMAPEVIMFKGYGKSADWWSFGILIYELLSKNTPFYHRDHMTMYDNIVRGIVRFSSTFSTNAKDLIRKLLQNDLSKRYGNLKNGSADIKNHQFFSKIDWQALFEKNVTPPYTPPELNVNMKTTALFHIDEDCPERYTKEFEDF